MGIVFAVVADNASLDAKKAIADKEGSVVGDVTNVADGTSLNGRTIYLGTPGNNPGSFGHLIYQGGYNLPQTRNRGYGIRAKFGFSGSPSTAIGLFSIKGTAQYPPCNELNINFGTNGLILASVSGPGNGEHYPITLGSFSPVAGQWYDIILNFSGVNGNNTMQLYIDGVAKPAVGPVYRGWNDPWQPRWQPAIVLGIGSNYVNGSGYGFSEFWITDGPIDASPYTGSTRTTPLNVSQYLGTTWPTEAQVLESTQWYENGVTKTGTLSTACPVSTDPGIENVLLGVEYQIDGTSFTGIYVAPETNNPGVENVLMGIRYKIEGESFVGELIPGEFGSDRTYYDRIFTLIGAETLTDDEWETLTVTGRDLSIEHFNEFKAILEGRESASNVVEKLQSYFLAAGVEVSYTPQAQTNIYLGGDLDT